MPERPGREALLRRQAHAEVAHWRLAVASLSDLDAVAAPTAWGAMEDYLHTKVRERLSGLIAALLKEAAVVEDLAAQGADGDRIRRGVLHLRTRYLQAETVLDFYGDAINTRTNAAMGGLLRGYDTLASDSMAASLVPLGMDSPPALVYVDKGLGAAILRAGIRLWDDAHPSPAAAIKLTRHNLSFPTALFHETGHQVAHLTGWNDELGEALHRAMAPRSTEAADLWRSWASEIAADAHAFSQAGWVPVMALSNVVDGSTAAAFRIRLGDPHPPPFLRVAFNGACCRSWFGAGPWDDLVAAWAARHPPAAAGREAAALTRVSIAGLPDLVDACTRRPMAAFGGRSLSTLHDPGRVSPGGLAELEQRAGPSLLTSSYLRRREPLRILALLSARGITDRQELTAHRARLRAWVTDLGNDAGARAPEGVAA